MTHGLITCKCGKTVTHTRGIGMDGRGFVAPVRIDGHAVTCPRSCEEVK